MEKDDWVEIPTEKDDWEEIEYPTGNNQAGLEHFGNAAAFGYLPQLQSAAEKPMSKVMDYISKRNVSKDLPDYTKRRDENIDRLGRQEKEFPAESLAGTIGGTISTALPIGKAALAVPELARMAKTGLMGRTAVSAGSAGLQGALSNPGDEPEEVDILQLTERGKKGLHNAGIAGALHLGGEGVSKVGSYISDRLKNKASELAFRAIGPFKRQVNQNRDEIKEIGREALDSGVVRWTPGKAATLEQRAADASEEVGQQLGNLTEELSHLESGAIKSGIERKQIAKNLRDKLITDNPGSIPGIKERNELFEKMINDFESASPNPRMNFAELRAAKTGVNKDLINYNRLKGADVPDKEVFHRALARELREGEETGAEAIEKAFYGKDSNRIKPLKEKYGRLEKVQEIAGKRADAQNANQILGLKDTIAGSTGAAIGAGLGYKLGSPKMGAAIGGTIGALGNKIARDYGAQFSAKTIDSFSKMLSKSPVFEKILSKNPTLIPQLLENIERKEKENVHRQR